MIRAVRRAIRQRVIRIGLLLADYSDFWHYPYHRDICNDWNVRLANLNWLYKSRIPFTRDEIGSGLEAYFSEHLEVASLFCPKDFKRKAWPASAQSAI